MRCGWDYDAITLFADVIRKVGEDRSQITEAIHGTPGWNGVCDTYDFTPDGDGLHWNSVVEIQAGGGLELLKAVTVKGTQGSVRAVPEDRNGEGKAATLWRRVTLTTAADVSATGRCRGGYPEARCPERRAEEDAEGGAGEDPLASRWLDVRKPHVFHERSREWGRQRRLSVHCRIVG